MSWHSRMSIKLTAGIVFKLVSLLESYAYTDYIVWAQLTNSESQLTRSSFLPVPGTTAHLHIMSNDIRKRRNMH